MPILMRIVPPLPMRLVEMHCVAGNMNLFQGEQNIQIKKLDKDRWNNAIMPGVRGNGRPANG